MCRFLKCLRTLGKANATSTPPKEALKQMPQAVMTSPTVNEASNFPYPIRYAHAIFDTKNYSSTVKSPFDRLSASFPSHSWNTSWARQNGSRSLTVSFQNFILRAAWNNVGDLTDHDDQSRSLGDRFTVYCRVSVYTCECTGRKRTTRVGFRFFLHRGWSGSGA